MTYRNDHEALEHKVTQLEQELEQTRAERLRLEAATHDEARIVADLHRVRTELHARAPRKLPLLEDLRIASPCHERWDAMTGDAHARHCERCDKNVYDLSSMTRDEAQALIVAKEGELCVRYYTRADGTVLTADCPVGVRLKRLRYAAAGAVGLIAAGVVSMAYWTTGSPVAMGEFTPQNVSFDSTPVPQPPATPSLLPVGQLQTPPEAPAEPTVNTPPATPYVSPTHVRMGRPAMHR